MLVVPRISCYLQWTMAAGCKVAISLGLGMVPSGEGFEEIWGR